MIKHPISNDLSAISTAVSYTKERPLLKNSASELAGLLKIETVPPEEQEEYDLLLLYTEKGLQIQLKHDKDARRPTTLHVDFLSAALNYRREHGGGIKQSLARAVGIKPGVRPTIIDATAGLGKDSFLLASLGCNVTMIERSPLLAAILRDGLERALASTVLQSDIKNRLHLLHGDASTLIAEIPAEERADTIYLDPMYPHKRKAALNRLEMRIIRMLVGDDTDAGQLLETALQYTKKRVVVKRPKGAPLLIDQPPSHMIKMKNSRYDVYMK